MSSIDWESMQHDVLLNPRWPVEAGIELKKTADEILQTHAKAPSVIVASSGSSAQSWREIKLVLLSKHAFLVAARSITEEFQIGSQDVLMNSLPLFHVGGASISARAFVSGAKLAQRDLQSQHGVDELWGDVLSSRASVLSLVPTQLFDLLERKTPVPDHLRLVFVGGASLHATLETQARERGWPLVVTYGMTETAAMIARRVEADTDFGYLPFSHVKMKRSRDGKICVQSQSLATGYGRIQSEGGWQWFPLVDQNQDQWFEADDRGYERRGRWFIEGRDSDYVKILGEAVNLAFLRSRLEQLALKKNLDPSGFYLSWLPSERRGAQLVLFIEDRMADSDELLTAFHEEVLPFERIQEIKRIAHLPRTSLGKISEQVLRQTLKGP